MICPQVEDELITDANCSQVGDDLQIIFRIPWGHNKIILDKCKGNSYFHELMKKDHEANVEVPEELAIVLQRFYDNI